MDDTRNGQINHVHGENASFNIVHVYGVACGIHINIHVRVAVYRRTVMYLHITVTGVCMYTYIYGHKGMQTDRQSTSAQSHTDAANKPMSRSHDQPSPTKKPRAKVQHPENASVGPASNDVGPTLNQRPVYVGDAKFRTIMTQRCLIETQ